MSWNVRPTEARALSRCALDDEPLATAIRLPFRPARSWIGELFGTRIAEPAGFEYVAATSRIRLPAAAAKIGGVSPTAPTSMAPAFSASSSGGPEVNALHWIW